MESLYERMGERRTIDAAVSIFYRRIAEDDRLSPYFEQVNLRQLRCKMADYLAAVLNDDPTAEEMDLKCAHAQFSISDGQFDMAVEHFKRTLETLGIIGQMQDEILFIIRSTRPEVVNC